MISNHNKYSQKIIHVKKWLENVSTLFPTEESNRIAAACELVEPLYQGQIVLTDIPLMQHTLGTASIMLDMSMDHETIVATILHAIPLYLTDWSEKIEQKFGANVKILISGLSHLAQIEQMSNISVSDKKNKTEHNHQIEIRRKMLLAMVDDIRVVLIKLAERTQTLRSLAHVNETQQILIAQKTRSVFAPLANRLGVWQLKWELEDLSVRYLEPELYKKIAKLLDERRVDRERYITDVITQIEQQLTELNIEAKVTGRAKHIYSIINKMNQKKLDFTQLYDVRAIRILVNDIKSCYTALSVVQNAWTAIPSEFDDYIARPKSNNYRSLHTAVMDKNGRAFEVQIRTHEMHQHSELGVAAHWRYKEGSKSDAQFDEKIIWLRQILEWKDELTDRKNLQQPFKNELFHDQVYVFTPLGKVIALPQGSTPVDFAYTLHTDLGHRTRGAKINGNIVPLSYKLQNGQRVEILTSKQSAPSRDWITPSLGFLTSTRARAKVRAWFKQQNFDESAAQGKVQLDKDLHRLGITSINQEKIAQTLHFNKLEDFYAAIGRNELTSHRIANAIHALQPNKLPLLSTQSNVTRVTSKENPADITVAGVSNLMIKIAKCCNPTPADDIVGYITRDRGITIHRLNCAFICHLTENRLDRKLSAQWH